MTWIPLERALTKLSAFEGASQNFLEIKLANPTKYLLEVQNSIKDKTVIQIEYLAGSRNEISSRKIEPEKILANGGKWYVQAYCKSSSAVKTFRVDRIKDIKTLDEIRENNSVEYSTTEDFFNLDNFPTAIIEIPIGDKSLIDGFPNIEIEEVSEEKIRLICPVASEVWFKYLLMVLGSGAEVLEMPTGIENTFRSKAAEEILGIYNS